MNSSERDVRFRLPIQEGEQIWVVLVDTAQAELPIVEDGCVMLQAHALMLLRYGADRRIATRHDSPTARLTPKEQHTL